MAHLVPARGAGGCVTLTTENFVKLWGLSKKKGEACTDHTMWHLRYCFASPLPVGVNKGFKPLVGSFGTAPCENLH